MVLWCIYNTINMNIQPQKNINTDIIVTAQNNQHIIMLLTRHRSHTSSKWVYVLNAYNMELEMVREEPLYESYGQNVHHMGMSEEYVAVDVSHWVRVYNINLQLVRQWQCPYQQVSDIGFMPDGKGVAAGGVGGVRVWELGTGRVLFSLDDVGVTVGNVVFSPSSKEMLLQVTTFISQSSSTLRIYDYTYPAYMFTLSSIWPVPSSLQLVSIASNPTNRSEYMLGIGSTGPQFYSPLSEDLYNKSTPTQPTTNTVKQVGYMGAGSRWFSVDSTGIRIWNNSTVWHSGEVKWNALVNKQANTIYHYQWQKLYMSKIVMKCSDGKWRKECQCDDGQIWAYSLGECVDCGSCKCDAGQYYDGIAMRCLLNCTQENAERFNYVPDECGCKQGLWENNKCREIQCYEYPHTITTPDGCRCRSPFIQNNGRCECPPYMVPLSDTCICMLPYQWNGTLSLCTIECPLQTAITNSPRLNMNFQECLCFDGYFYDVDEHRRVYQCRRNCSMVERGIGGVGGWDGTCECEEGWLWRVQKGRCELDCGVVAQTYQYDEQNKQCICSRDFFWESSINQCVMNCSNIKHALPTNSTHVQCKCGQKYSWNQLTRSCKINCSNINKAQFITSDQQCECNYGYQWSKDNKQCELYCQDIEDAVRDGEKCICLDGKVYDEKNKVCVWPTSTQSVFDNLWVILGLIVGGIIVLICLAALVRKCCCQEKFKHVPTYSIEQPKKKHKSQLFSARMISERRQINYE